MTAAAPPSRILLPAVAALIRITHGPGCPDMGEWRAVATRLDEAADPAHPGHADAVRAARLVLESLAAEPAEVA